MGLELRNAAIAELLRDRGRVEIGPLADHFGVSQMTIRRSLDEMARSGVARRVRGGALAIGSAQFDDRQRSNARAKVRIAAKLLELVPTSGTIALDASSTVERLARVLEGAHDLTVVTNGLACFEALIGKPGVHPMLTGGEPEPRTGSLVGPLAERAAAELNYDVVICSAVGLDAVRGSSEASVQEAAVKRVFGERSLAVVLAVDRSKLGTHGPAAVFGLDRLAMVVSELDPDDSRLDDYRAQVDVR